MPKKQSETPKASADRMSLRREVPIDVKDPTEDKFATLEDSIVKLHKDFKQVKKDLENVELDIYSRLTERETDILDLSWQTNRIKAAILVLCIVLTAFFVISILKILWTK